MEPASPLSTARVGVAALTDMLADIFVAHDVAAANARLLAENCAGCERDGTKSHGIFRMPGYVSSLSCRWVDGRAVPSVEFAQGAFIRVDAANGFAQPALAAAKPAVLETVSRQGAAVLAIRNSHHFSALWPDVEPFAELGLVALSVVNSFACVVPEGGRRPVYGTNPMAFATPVQGLHPFVFDQSSSSLSNGDVQIAAREGRLLPDGAGIDRDGRRTTDPKAVLDGGALLPFGGHKGASIAFMIEVLAAALTGGQFSHEVDFSTHPGAQTPRTGQLLIVIDPSFGGRSGFAGRVAQLVSMAREAGVDRLAGDMRFQKRAVALRDGILLSNAEMSRLSGLARAR